MEKRPMNVAISLNQKYFYYTYVMLTSLFENNTDSQITVYVMHSELTVEQIDKYSLLAAEYKGKICSVYIEQEKFEVLSELPTTDMWSIEAYFRLMMPDVLPKEVERILYLDVDIIVNGNIREFYDTDFSDKLLCVCKEEVANDLERASEQRKKIFAELFDKGFFYFNSGVLLYNMKELRQKYNFAIYMETAKQLGSFETPDQDILNYCHWNEIMYAETEVYDWFAREAHYAGRDYTYIRERVRMIHFAGAKPWNADNIHFDIEQIWWDYAKKTPYYGKLCEEFTYKTINDPFIENYIKDLYEYSNTLQANLNDSIALNEKLLAMLNQR